MANRDAQKAVAFSLKTGMSNTVFPFNGVSGFAKDRSCPATDPTSAETAVSATHPNVTLKQISDIHNNTMLARSSNPHTAASEKVKGSARCI